MAINNLTIPLISGEVLKFLKTYMGISLQRQFTRLALGERDVEMCYLSFVSKQLIEYGIFGEGSQILTNQMLESTIF